MKGRSLEVVPLKSGVPLKTIIVVIPTEGFSPTEGSAVRRQRTNVLSSENMSQSTTSVVPIKPLFSPESASADGRALALCSRRHKQPQYDFLSRLCAMSPKVRYNSKASNLL